MQAPVLTTLSDAGLRNSQLFTALPAVEASSGVRFETITCDFSLPGSFCHGRFVHVFICCFLSFLIGGIPFGYLTGRLLLKDDIRNHGSGNIGATNVGRVIGWKWGGIVLLLDALKGMLPTIAAMKFTQHNLSPDMHYHLPVAAGISAILGHMYPIYLKLRGGKGVATALGVVLVLAPKALGIAFLVFAAIAATTKIVALASILSAVVFGIAQLSLMGDAALLPAKLSLTGFAIGIPLLIIWRHRSNITRMLKGTEAAFNSPAEDDEPITPLDDKDESASP